MEALHLVNTPVFRKAALYWVAINLMAPLLHHLLILISESSMKAQFTQAIAFFVVITLANIYAAIKLPAYRIAFILTVLFNLISLTMLGMLTFPYTIPSLITLI